jgi:hypothetical protein
MASQAEAPSAWHVHVPTGQPYLATLGLEVSRCVSPSFLPFLYNANVDANCSSDASNFSAVVVAVVSDVDVVATIVVATATTNFVAFAHGANDVVAVVVVVGGASLLLLLPLLLMMRMRD